MRRDLYQGKYAPDLERQKQFELEMEGNLPWNSEQRKNRLNAMKYDDEIVKDEL